MTAGGSAPVGGGLRAVVFDLDGVLIDTEPVWRRVEMEVFGSLGLHLTEADCRETMGMRVEEAVRLWHSRRPWSGESVASVTHRLVAGVIDHVRTDGAPIPGAVEALLAVRALGLRCAIASSSPRALIEAVVARLAVASLIDVLCSAVDEARGKPAPDVYLTAARMLGLPPGACLAIEDSAAGVMAARAAGMPCVVIPDAVTAADPRLRAATLRLASLAELDRDRLETLGAAYLT